ncbi:nascent polypeptide-associated complex protein [Nanoarchaeota archaeon]
MIPGMNKKQMERAMKQMGIKQVDIDASEVIIRCPDREIVISNPAVAKVNMMGQDTWQITGVASERGLDASPDISEEDIATVMEQTGKNKEDALAAIQEADGDLAQAIMNLS